MINIVIPMAGRGSRFADNGYELPKPLIPVHGIPMIELVIKNLTPSIPHTFTFICREEHLQTYNLEKYIENATQNYNLLPIKKVTQGAACTVLLAEELINNQDQLMIANCDQYISVSIDEYLANFSKSRLEGFIMTMTANDPKWSFVKLNNMELVEQVREKEVVSSEATVGIYNFQRGSDFVRGAQEMIRDDERVGNEFYVAPVYNRLISDKFRVGVFNIGSEKKGMYGLGIPSDLEFFNALPNLP